jgi:hypothetical protein
VREKYCLDWKNKLKSTDYKPTEQGSRLDHHSFCTALVKHDPEANASEENAAAARAVKEHSAHGGDQVQELVPR